MAGDRARRNADILAERARTMQARLNKEAHPERFCTKSGCLYRFNPENPRDGGVKAGTRYCPKHFQAWSDFQDYAWQVPAPPSQGPEADRILADERHTFERSHRGER